jgi:hypothetical protein
LAAVLPGCVSDGGGGGTAIVNDDTVLADDDDVTARVDDDDDAALVSDEPMVDVGSRVIEPLALLLLTAEVVLHEPNVD